MLLQRYKKIISFIFFIIVILDIAGIIVNIKMLQFVVKPLLMTALLLVLLQSNIWKKKIVLIALFSSWLGDIFLLFGFAKQDNL